MRAEIRIGTSGWHYSHWRGNFYPQRLPAAGQLAHYVQHFDAVELNNSFYRLPPPETFQAWHAATPPGFRFAVKASRFITHNKKLKEPRHALQNLLPRAALLGEKLGPVLFQLPPRWRLNRDRLAEFLEALPRRHRYVFEFREPSWLVPEVFRLLQRHDAAFCIFDLAGAVTPVILTTDFAYVRLHGPSAQKYAGSYSEAALAAWARQAESWYGLGRSVWIFFDNDQAGYAAQNALRLRQLLSAPERAVLPAA